jgi:hypothetical protein
MYSELKLTDRILIGVQSLILLYGLTFHLLTILSNYFTSISPLIPVDIQLRILKPNLFLFGYFLIMAFVSWKIFRNYKRRRFIFLITGTLMFEFIIAIGINDL